jgi:hypothetical protein
LDEKLSQALELGNFVTTFNTQKRLLWEKYQDNLLFYVSGHEIKITLELINFCELLQRREIEQTILVDANNLPFEVANIAEFLDEVLDQYAQASNNYFSEYATLKKNRSVEKAVEL